MRLSKYIIFGFIVSLLSPIAVEGQVIIKDSFASGENAATLQGSTPEVDLPHSTYNTTGYFGASNYNRNLSVGNPEGSGSAETGGSAAMLISIASTSGYVKPKEITISADIRLGSINIDSDTVRGIFLGFRSDASVPDADPTAVSGYSGLQLAPDGTVYLRTREDTTSGLKSLGSYNTAVLGQFAPEDFYNLSYTINTATGAYSNAVLTRVTGTHAGVSVRLAQVVTSTFNDANTNAAGSYADAHEPNVFGQVDNFTVSGPSKPVAKK